MDGDFENPKEIYEELISDDSYSRAQFIKTFQIELEHVSKLINSALRNWRSLDIYCANKGKIQLTSAIVFCSCKLHIDSMKLFLAGHTIASGNICRQSIESMCLSILCSRKNMRYLDQFIKNEYSTNNSLRDIQRDADKLHIKNSTIVFLDKNKKYYDNFSHPTHQTIISVISLADGKALFISPSFDKQKMEGYKKEINLRIDLAKLLIEVIEIVMYNIRIDQQA